MKTAGPVGRLLSIRRYQTLKDRGKQLTGDSVALEVLVNVDYDARV